MTIFNSFIPVNDDKCLEQQQQQQQQQQHPIV